MSVLANIHYQPTHTSGVQLQPQVVMGGRIIPLPDPQIIYRIYFITWSAGHSTLPSTWRELLQVLQDIRQLELRQQIEAFMKGICTHMFIYLI